MKMVTKISSTVRQIVAPHHHKEFGVAERTIIISDD